MWLKNKYFDNKKKGKIWNNKQKSKYFDNKQKLNIKKKGISVKVL
jgi:hypothetical protein